MSAVQSAQEGGSMATGELIVVIVLSWLVMGFSTCWMRANISHVDNFTVATVAFVFWLWPIWFVWVLPVCFHEHAIARKTSVTNW